MCWYIERDLDDEGREKFRNALERTEVESTPKPKRKKLISENGKEFVPVPGQRWKAPPGWKPPGWNEEKSYKAAMSFMSFQANPK